MKKILIIIGTRPNFIKVTQFKRVAEQYKNLEIKIAHTGQHYDAKMSDIFFEQFGLTPDYFMNIPQASPNTQMAEIMLRLEDIITNKFTPDLIIVPGDVNSTFAAALTANKLGIKIAHLESGLRSFDRTMPEEINRILTDEITDYYFITEQSGIDHLQEEKKHGKPIFVGNTMIDTMVAFEKDIQASSIMNDLKLEKQKFVLMTIHRPALVDVKVEIQKLLSLIQHLSENYKIVFPIHPRTVNNLKKFNLFDEFNKIKNLILGEPMDYFSFQKLIANCSFILTDSGGIQEESTFRQVPCLTLRPNTERPITITMGTNKLIEFDLDKIKSEISAIENETYKKGEIPPFWDGKATERILKFIDKELKY
ncbi:MAG: UDP-N-acetylglucosamine 2-epimerase (non-hydrolyzing) [Bacteroidetes bacterium]|nr:MAG: UDP-N-acetylglucosamine 2-epimerase (non-hydrolyzing) [Bacteroidota bacterium]